MRIHFCTVLLLLCAISVSNAQDCMQSCISVAKRDGYCQTDQQCELQCARECGVTIERSEATDPRDVLEFQQPSGACIDSVYIALRQIPLSEMSDREYQVFSLKDQTCMDSPSYQPCADSLYLALRREDLNSMSERTFDVFSRKDEACTSIQNQGGIVAVSSTSQGTPYSMGLMDGMQEAGQVSTGNNFAGGLLGGVTLGLIGTLIAYTASGDNNEIPSVTILRIQNRGNDYLLGYQTGYQQEVRSKKKKAALSGGLIGTGILLAIVLTQYN